MGPKDILEIGKPRAELSLMDRMYLKFEALCVEADKNPSILLQEASKYVESQVTTVKGNMRKLCTELMRDLLPEPEESGKEACKCEKAQEQMKGNIEPIGKDQSVASKEIAEALPISQDPCKIAVIDGGVPEPDSYKDDTVDGSASFSGSINLTENLESSEHVIEEVKVPTLVKAELSGSKGDNVASIIYSTEEGGNFGSIIEDTEECDNVDNIIEDTEEGSAHWFLPDAYVGLGSTDSAYFLEGPTGRESDSDWVIV